ncbi:hypothetical protein [Conexibacter sp. DBS9H8]|uniref:hypothetical protein n=1 Tax=Conexibacter sp. DBS9H8 TaxID=2937801 RepID=UPI00200FC800|nr:hypothetical protein [Conexibacter sp. DBS9H8]
MPTPPAAHGSEQLLARGWEWAAATLAGAPSPERLVTHWFSVPGDERVNTDDHFGSDTRTLRFLAVALPTLIVELGARAGVVVVPWGLESDWACLTVVALTAGAPVAVAARTLAATRNGPPFWRIGDLTAPPPEIVEVCAGLSISASR